MENSNRGVIFMPSASFLRHFQSFFTMGAGLPFLVVHHELKVENNDQIIKLWFGKTTNNLDLQFCGSELTIKSDINTIYGYNSRFGKECIVNESGKFASFNCDKFYAPWQLNLNQDKSINTILLSQEVNDWLKSIENPNSTALRNCYPFTEVAIPLVNKVKNLFTKDYSEEINESVLSFDS